MHTPTGTTRRRFLAYLGAAAPGAVMVSAGCSSEEVDDPDTAGPPVPGTDAAIIDGDIGRAVDEYLTATVPDGPGVTIAVALADELVYCKGFGPADRDAGIAADCDTGYDIGSITKSFTGTAVTAMAADGILSPDDPIGEFVDGVPDDKRDVSVHHLLTHTSGLIDSLGDDYDALSRQDMLAAAVDSELLWPPGTRYRYSNLGFSVLAAIIETVTSQSYEEYLAERVLTPAGMTHTGYRLPQWRDGQLAVEYDPAGSAHGTPLDHPWDTDGPYWNLRGNGGLLSTARDMFRFHVALRGDDILTGEAKDLMFQPHVPEDGGESHYGYGWVIADAGGTTFVTHNGGNGRSGADYARTLDGGAMIFWAGNAAEADGEWNLWDLDVLSGIARILLDTA